MNNGFLHLWFDLIFKALYYLNLVELFKSLSKKAITIVRASQSLKIEDKDLRFASNLAIDVFQLFKWLLLLLFWVYPFVDPLAKYVIYYLLASNLFTYFYYHVWGSQYKQSMDRETVNRRFLNSILAIAFYIFCYAYLYQVHFVHMINWPSDGQADFTNAIYLSVANAFTLTYGGFAPLTQEVRVLFMSQLITTFFFFTIIISNSIPNHQSDS